MILLMIVQSNIPVVAVRDNERNRRPALAVCANHFILFGVCKKYGNCGLILACRTILLTNYFMQATSLREIIKTPNKIRKRMLAKRSANYAFLLLETSGSHRQPGMSRYLLNHSPASFPASTAGLPALAIPLNPTSQDKMPLR